jgi:hypothetical protein
MAILFETNGDWPDTDQDYMEVTDEEEGCFICESRTTSACICDEVYDNYAEDEIMAEFND